MVFDNFYFEREKRIMEEDVEFIELIETRNVSIKSRAKRILYE